MVPHTVAEAKMYRFTASLPYLLNRVGVRMGELFANELAANHLTIPMYRVLAALSEADNQRLTDLSAMTTVEMTTLSRLVASMEKRHMLRRIRPDDNLRTVQISLTKTGRELAARLCPRAAYYERIGLKNLSMEAVESLKATLVTVYENLDEIEHEQAEARVKGQPPARGPRRKAA
jgi:DNA-binding MarR family transcriptional regulator